MPIQNKYLQLRSLVKSNATLELSLVEVDTPEPQDDQVLVEIGASPINPSDLGLLLGFADLATARSEGTKDRPVITADIPENLLRNLQARLDESLPVGNEGAGVVVAAGASPDAQALLGKTVAIVAGAMYSQYRIARSRDCLVLNADTTAVEGASCFVNPLTALGMVETMRLEGHTALVHTAAASNLGQMLNKICINEGIDLVNIVRRAEHVDLLRSIGAKHICDSSLPSFREDLTDALSTTGATLAFDATGGGQLAGNILAAMEVAANLNAKEYNRYGSSVHKQVYIYGGLDRTPTTFTRNFGTAWGIGGWLLTPFLQKIGDDAAQVLRQRVADEIKTTFASHYSRKVSLVEALQLDSLRTYSRQATGEKFLICPHG